MELIDGNAIAAALIAELKATVAAMPGRARLNNNVKSLTFTVSGVKEALSAELPDEN